ncbi:MAG: hypothetical protein N3E51_02350 [Candidatus Micrarchaeota archaeon]|nr:hypothetical protein [Candidatus Micrarchaeota archaeon]
MASRQLEEAAWHARRILDASTKEFSRLKKGIEGAKRQFVLAGEKGLLLTERKDSEKKEALASLLLTQEKLKKLVFACEETQKEEEAFRLAAEAQKLHSWLENAKSEHFFQQLQDKSFYCRMLLDGVQFSTVAAVSHFIAQTLPPEGTLSLEKHDEERNILYFEGKDIGTYCLFKTYRKDKDLGALSPSAHPIEYQLVQGGAIITLAEISIRIRPELLRRQLSENQKPLIWRMFYAAGLDFGKLDSEMVSFGSQDGRYEIKPKVEEVSLFLEMKSPTSQLVFTYEIPFATPPKLTFTLCGSKLSVRSAAGREDGLESYYRL